MGKGAKEQRVVIAPALGRRLQRYADRVRPKDVHTDRLFLTTRRSRRTGVFEPLSKGTTEIMCKSAAVRAGIDPKRVWPHVFRHSCCTYLPQQNVSPAKVMQLLGHSRDAGVQPAPASRCHGRRDQSIGVKLAVGPTGIEAPALTVQGLVAATATAERGRIREVGRFDRPTTSSEAPSPDEAERSGPQVPEVGGTWQCTNPLFVAAEPISCLDLGSRHVAAVIDRERTEPDLEAPGHAT